MKKLTTALLIGSGALLFTACGGGGGGSGGNTPTPVDPMTQKQAVIIFYHTPAGMCADPYFQNEVINGIANEGYTTYNWLFREETLNVTCSTYGKPNDINDYGGCMTQDIAALDPRSLSGSST